MAMTEFETRSAAAADALANAAAKSAAQMEAQTANTLRLLQAAEAQLALSQSFLAEVRGAAQRDERRASAVEAQNQHFSQHVQAMRDMTAAAGRISEAEAKQALLAVLTPNYMKPSTATTPNGMATDAQRDAQYLHAAFDAAWPVWRVAMGFSDQSGQMPLPL